ncbi:MAG: hypothetical protein JKP98_11930 [Rhodobacteraceae bacterium]|nr:hypothetical protein [Paracoccaceae bacterium]
MLFIAVALGLIVAGLRFYEQSRLSSMVADHTRLLNGIVTEMRDANMRTGRVAIWTDLVDGDGNPVWAADPPWRDVASYLAKAGAVPATRWRRTGPCMTWSGGRCRFSSERSRSNRCSESWARAISPGFRARFRSRNAHA